MIKQKRDMRQELTKEELDRMFQVELRYSSELKAENRLLKTIVEQLLNIELTPKFKLFNPKQ